MSDALSAFPSRKLYARPPGGGVLEYFWALIGFLVIGGMLVFSLAWVAPDLWTDWQVRDKAVPIRGANIDGSCTSKLFVHMCDATLTAPAGAATISRTVHYIFGSFNIGDFTARVVADPGRPELLTTDLGLDRFWDRVITLVLALALLTAIIVGGFAQLVRSRRSYVAWRKVPLVPVPLKLLGRQRTRGGAVWTVRADNGKTARWTFPRRAKPFILGPDDRVLGLATQGGGSILPLDAGLRWVVLSPEERAAVLAAQRGSAAPAAASLAPAYSLKEHRVSDRLIRFTKGQDEVVRLFCDENGRWSVSFDPMYAEAKGPQVVGSEQAGRALINATLRPRWFVEPGGGARA